MELFSGGKQRIVLDRERGDSLQAIGERRGISYQRVQTIVRDARAHIDKIEMDLLVARNEAVAFGLAIPNQDQLDRAIALDYLQWVLTRLRSRDLDIEVTTKHTPEGLIVFLEDKTNYSKSKER